MPKEKEIIREFKNFHRYLQVPFAIYADFEAMSLKINECNKSPDEWYTKTHQEDVDCRSGYKVVCCCDDKIQ